MKLYEVLDDMSKQIYDEVAIQIAQDCKPYLKATNVGDIRLWRGMQSSGAYQKKTTRQQRNPLDTHPVVHQAANEYFNNQFGIPLRSQSTFVAPDRLSAMRFGSPHLVFPIGSQWRMYGSPYVRDFTAHVNKAMYDQYIPQLFMDKVSKGKWSGGQPPEMTDEEQQQVQHAVEQILEQAEYQQIQPNELANFPETNEIMLVADSYYAVVASYNDADDLYQMIGSHLNSQ